jgi:alkanesulfonate monooxygenase SsuD/methylene tetrahydromethanopterin reductase-like flavin-dependent oxidoreductase (luciferase family)
MKIDIILNEFASADEACELGLLAESYGVRGIWASNYGWSRDPFMVLSKLALESEKILMGPMAITAAELHPLKMANLLATLNEMSHGRAMIMVGGGGAVLQSIGMKRERMVRHARECLEILREHGLCQPAQVDHGQTAAGLFRLEPSANPAFVGRARGRTDHQRLRGLAHARFHSRGQG